MRKIWKRKKEKKNKKLVKKYKKLVKKWELVDYKNVAWKYVKKLKHATAYLKNQKEKKKDWKIKNKKKAVYVY